MVIVIVLVIVGIRNKLISARSGGSATRSQGSVDGRYLTRLVCLQIVFYVICLCVVVLFVFYCLCLASLPTNMQLVLFNLKVVLPRSGNTGVCAKTLLLSEPFPCHPAAETALQPLIWCSESLSSNASSSPEVFSSQTPVG